MINKEYIWVTVAIIAIFILWWQSRNNSTSSKSSDASPNVADSTQNLAVLEISVQNGKEFPLYILMHSDGTNNRGGAMNESLTKVLPDAPKAVYMGPSEKPMLGEMLDGVTKELAELKGEHDLGGGGDPLELTITIQIANRGLRIKYKYGSESSGPPSPVKEYVSKAVQLTNTWITEIEKNKKKK
jgi:hypothetical protein